MFFRRRTDIKHLKWNIFVLPNILTSVNLFCGFYSILYSIDGNFVIAALAIVISGIFDSLDGKIARATNSTSLFGLEYDSLSDLISFGLAPSLLMHLWVLKSLGFIGNTAVFFFATCGALRLARFNCQSKINDCGNNVKYFLGLPITAAAWMVAFTVLFFFCIGLSSLNNSYLILTMVYILSFLMISNVRYVSFKNNKRYKTTVTITFLSLLIASIYITSQPSIVLFGIGCVYVLSGPVLGFFYSLYDNQVTRQFGNVDISDEFD